MSVLLRKVPSKIEVYNDINNDVVNFFKILRERTDELIASLELTPYSRLEFAISQQTSEDELERARRFFIWSWQGRGRAGVKEPGGWRFMSRNTRGRTPVDDWNNINHLFSIAERLKMIQIEHDDAFKVIKRFDGPDTLFYIDPPYLAHTRSNRWGTSAYKYEMDNEQHRELAELLNSAKGKVIVSGYPSELYNELYKGWEQVDKSGQVDRGKRGGRERIERLWMRMEVGYDEGSGQ